MLQKTRGVPQWIAVEKCLLFFLHTLLFSKKSYFQDAFKSKSPFFFNCCFFFYENWRKNLQWFVNMGEYAINAKSVEALLFVSMRDGALVAKIYLWTWETTPSMQRVQRLFYLWTRETAFSMQRVQRRFYLWTISWERMLLIQRVRKRFYLFVSMGERSKCKECGGAPICEHGRQRSQCKKCGGASICEQSRASPLYEHHPCHFKTLSPLPFTKQ